jgi:hypothetical protein
MFSWLYGDMWQFAVDTDWGGMGEAVQFLLSPLSLMWEPATVCRTSLSAEWNRLRKRTPISYTLRATALTNWGSKSPSWAPHNHSHLQESPPLLRNQNVHCHCRVSKGQPVQCGLLPCTQFAAVAMVAPVIPARRCRHQHELRPVTQWCVEANRPGCPLSPWRTAVCCARSNCAAVS